MKTAICNASPLITMAKADLLQVFPEQFSSILVPTAVAEEIMKGPEKDPIRRQLNELPWLKQVTLEPPLAPLAFWQLGRGEAEVIELARRNQDTLALLDDKDARNAATALRIPVMGTLGLIARSALSGRIASFNQMVDRLKNAGIYLDARVISQVREGLEEK